MFTPEEQAEGKEFLAAIRSRTDPHNPDAPTPVALHPSPTVKSIRAMLAEAKAFFAEVSPSLMPL